MVNTLTTVFRQKRYILLAVIVSLVIFTFATWLPNFDLVRHAVVSDSFNLIEKVSLLGSLMASIKTNFTLLSALYTVLIAILFGLNVAMIVFYKKTFGGKLGGSATGIGGLISGIFGMGCAACGSLILNSVLPLIGAAGLIAFLPLNGGEFGILAVIILGYSFYQISKKIQNPEACKVLKS